MTSSNFGTQAARRHTWIVSVGADSIFGAERVGGALQPMRKVDRLIIAETEQVSESPKVPLNSRAQIS
jgi:hypothetical protein